MKNWIMISDKSHFIHQIFLYLPLNAYFECASLNKPFTNNQLFIGGLKIPKWLLIMAVYCDETNVPVALLTILKHIVSS